MNYKDSQIGDYALRKYGLIYGVNRVHGEFCANYDFLTTTIYKIKKLKGIEPVLVHIPSSTVINNSDGLGKNYLTYVGKTPDNYTWFVDISKSLGVSVDEDGRTAWNKQVALNGSWLLLGKYVVSWSSKHLNLFNLYSTNGLINYGSGCLLCRDTKNELKSLLKSKEQVTIGVERMAIMTSEPNRLKYPKYYFLLADGDLLMLGQMLNEPYRESVVAKNFNVSNLDKGGTKLVYIDNQAYIADNSIKLI